MAIPLVNMYGSGGKSSKATSPMSLLEVSEWDLATYKEHCADEGNDWVDINPEKDPSKRSYLGCTLKGQPDDPEGWGMETEPEENYVYTGWFKDRDFHGQGELVTNGDRFWGQFAQNSLNGFANYELKNGQRGRGQYVNGEKEGVCHWEFEGTWSKSICHHDKWTYGFVQEPNGEHGQCAFKDDNFNGENCYWHMPPGIDPSGGRDYIGGFKDDVFDGEGTLTFWDGSTFTGTFKDDDMLKGVLTEADGTVSEIENAY